MFFTAGSKTKSPTLRPFSLDTFIRYIFFLFLMFAAETQLKNAQKVKEYLAKHHLFNPQYKLVKELGVIFFPLIKKAKVPHALVKKVAFNFPSVEKAKTVEEVLKNCLTLEELALLPKSQEIVGNILILEIPLQLGKKEKLIAEAYLKLNKQVATIVKKKEMHTGMFRTRKVTILAGKKTKETTHLENGVRIKLHLENTYFSARSAHERLRIAHLVKKGERVLVMFSGVAPYPLVLAKQSPAKLIYGVELNPIAHQYALENVSLNRLNSKITLIRGDVCSVLPKLKQKFDRIIMPLPKTGEDFLGIAFKKAKKGTIIHLYAFLEEKEISAQAKKIITICKQLKHPVKILKKVKCGQFSPGTFRICFDLKTI